MTDEDDESGDEIVVVSAKSIDQMCREYIERTGGTLHVDGDVLKDGVGKVWYPRERDKVSAETPTQVERVLTALENAGGRMSDAMLLASTKIPQASFATVISKLRRGGQIETDFDIKGYRLKNGEPVAPVIAAKARKIVSEYDRNRRVSELREGYGPAVPGRVEAATGGVHSALRRTVGEEAAKVNRLTDDSGRRIVPAAELVDQKRNGVADLPKFELDPRDAASLPKSVVDQLSRGGREMVARAAAKVTLDPPVTVGNATIESVEIPKHMLDSGAKLRVTEGADSAPIDLASGKAELHPQAQALVDNVSVALGMKEPTDAEAGSLSELLTADDPLVLRIRELLAQAGGDGITRTGVRDALQRNVHGARIDAVLMFLSDNGFAAKIKVATAGRPCEVWREMVQRHGDSMGKTERAPTGRVEPNQYPPTNERDETPTPFKGLDVTDPVVQKVRDALIAAGAAGASKVNLCALLHGKVSVSTVDAALELLCFDGIAYRSLDEPGMWRSMAWDAPEATSRAAPRRQSGDASPFSSNSRIAQIIHFLGEYVEIMSETAAEEAADMIAEAKELLAWVEGLPHVEAVRHDYEELAFGVDQSGRLVICGENELLSAEPAGWARLAKVLGALAPVFEGKK